MKDRTILAIKGLAIIGVVFHHLINRREIIQTSEWLWVLLMMFHWCVMAFICTSGFLHAWSDTRRQKPVGEFIALRVNRLLVPWLLLVIVYALIWQMLSLLHVSNIAVKLPANFFSKIAVSLWPVDSTVGEQLYYLPLLFGSSVVFVLVRGLFGLRGVWILMAATFAVGLFFYMKEFMGFRVGTFIWSVSFYAAGYLLFQYRAKVNEVRLALMVVTLVLAICDRHYGLIRCVPLWLITEGSLLGLSKIPGLCSVGEASGTIYIYHTPFLLQPLVIAATYLHGAVPQFVGVLCADALAMGVCYVFYHLAKNTRAKILLM